MIRLLDLCCKAGGGDVGYFKAAKQAGLDIEIVGVDIKPQPNYPFEFVKAEGIDYLKKHWKGFTHIHASPPCQAYSCATNVARKKGKVYPDLLPIFQNELQKIPLRSVIENVLRAPIRKDLVLCGHMFGLKVIRYRAFQLNNFFMMQPFEPQRVGGINSGHFVGVYGKASLKGRKNESGTVTVPTYRKKTIRETWAFAMGIDWKMTDVELAEAIPPAYTEYIGFDFFK